MSSTTEIASLREKLAAAEAQVERLRQEGPRIAVQSIAAYMKAKERAEAAEADARRYRWLRGEVQGPHIPLAQVVWKLHGDRNSGQWTNLSDGASLDAHIDAAIDAHLEPGEG